ncbi:hypothetical protein [Paenibacillus macquariensis]|nr:hypothetical protein [Paenibacillus macquariensis]MEC0093181.1 hypothetical protein [Paenibacillus macquariensis]OAB35071.1 hypothetical protein PMSM_10840 [Paenibacillus macquariensis subsp. macquariensis]
MSLSKGGSQEGAQSRVNAAVISGTVFLNSDNVFDETAQQYMKTLLTNPQVNALAIKGKAFRAVEGNTGTNAADVFMLADKGTYYLAVFNYTARPVERLIDLKRGGINSKGVSSYKITDMWTAQTNVEESYLKVSLKGAESKLYKFEPNQGVVPNTTK